MSILKTITKTRLYNFDPLKPHFYILNWGLQGYTLFFLFLLKNIDCGYSLEPPRQAVLTSTHNLCFEQKYEKYQSFSSENFQFLEMKFSIYLNRRVFDMQQGLCLDICTMALSFRWDNCGPQACCLYVRYAFEVHIRN